MRKLSNDEFPTKKTFGFNHCLAELEQILDKEIESGIRGCSWRGHPRQYLPIQISDKHLISLGVNFCSLQQLQKAARKIYHSDWKVKLDMTGHDTHYKHRTDFEYGLFVFAELRFYPKR